MKKKRAFTLVETLMSSGIFGMIALIGLSVISLMTWTLFSGQIESTSCMFHTKLSAHCRTKNKGVKIYEKSNVLNFVAVYAFKSFAYGMCGRRNTKRNNNNS